MQCCISSGRAVKFLTRSRTVHCGPRVARFAERYYNTLHTDPSELYSFYSADAVFERWVSTQAAEALKVRRVSATMCLCCPGLH